MANGNPKPVAIASKGQLSNCPALIGYLKHTTVAPVSHPEESCFGIEGKIVSRPVWVVIEAAVSDLDTSPSDEVCCSDSWTRQHLR